MPPPETPRRDDPEGQLPEWSGTPLDEDLFRPYLEDGVLFCQIGDPQQYEAILVIDQADLEFVRELLLKGKPPVVDIKLDALPTTRSARKSRRSPTEPEGQPEAALEQGRRTAGHDHRSEHGRGETPRQFLPGPRRRSTTTKPCSAWASAAPAASTPPGSRWARGSGGW